MLNKIMVMGRLVRDPELKQTQSGKQVCTITLACDRDYRAKDGSDRQTDFIDVVAWGQRAEFVSKYFSKGRLMVVEGRLESRKWTDKNGQNRTSWEIQASNCYFADSKRDGQETAPQKPASTPSYTPSPASGFAEIEEDGDLPF